MKKTLSILSITIFISVILISSASAMRVGQGNLGKGGYHCFNNLTPEEQSLIKTERANFFNQTKGLRTDIFNKKMELEQEFASETIDTAKVKTLRSEIFSLRQSMAEKRQAHLEKINEIIPGYSNCGFGPNQGKKHYKSKGIGGCRGFI
ncbi:MAG: periplasmic heavy metal sensor [Desulforegulaceae bacterium]|nr:periplasmic heavy metal sensor [Desulforegulaceae bacterium]